MQNSIKYCFVSLLLNNIMNSLLSINHTKKCLFLFLFVGFFAKAQTLHIGSNTSEKLTITENTSLYIEGLTISPSSDFHLSNTKLSKSGSTSNTISSSINRSYLFNTTTASFTGSLKISYQVGELNGETENSLGLVLFIGGNWENQSTTSSDTSSNFIVASVNGKTLKELTLSNYVNNPPTDISLTSNIISETASIGSLVGTLSATDPDTSISSLTFSFTSSGDAQDNDNGSFTINGTSLLTSSTLDYETKTSYNIYVNVSDGTSNYAKGFTVSVTNVLEPVTDLGFEVASIVTDGLVVYLDAEDSDSYSGSGNTWNDISGNGHDFNVGGAVFSNADFGHFNYTGQYSSSNSNINLTFPNGYSVIILMKYNSFGGGSFNYNNSPSYINFYNGNNSKLRWETKAGQAFYSQTSLSTGSWYLLTGTHQGATSDSQPGTAKLYINNSLDKSQSLQTNASMNSTMELGRYAGNFNGAISAFLFYDKELSQEEVSKIYESFENRITGASPSPTSTGTSTISVNEEVSIGTVAATLTATDSDTTSFTFSLVSGDGTNDQHNASFTISGTQLLVNSIIDYETTPTLNIYVQASDGNSTFAKALTVNVNDVNEPPVITSTAIITDNSTVSVTFSELVYGGSSIATSTLEVTDFALSISGGTATLSSSTPSSITISGTTIGLGISLSGIADGNELLTISPVADSIFDSQAGTASTTQTSNTVNLTPPNSTPTHISLIELDDNEISVGVLFELYT